MLAAIGGEQPAMRLLVPASTLLLLGFAACSSSAATAPKAAAAPANAATTMVGSRAPAFQATTLAGKSVGLSDFTGKVLVLNFWATWCPPCRAETPDVIRAYAKLDAPDVAFLGIDTTETAPVVKSFVALKGVSYPVALSGPETYNAYGIAYIPTTIVVDPHGVVRARWTGGITPAQLTQYVASARAGKSSWYVTPDQRRIDGELAAAQFHFTGSPASVAAEIVRANKALTRAAADEAALDAGSALRYDPERTQRETGELELAVARASAALATTPKERLAADVALGKAYADLNRFADAVAVYKAALAVEPHSPALVAALTTAYYRLHDYDAMADTATQLAHLSPKDPSAWDQLGLANQRRRNFTAALPAYTQTLDLMIADAKGKPIGKDGDAVAGIADESLDFANIYVALGDAPNARRIFDQAQRYAVLIPSNGRYAALKTIVPQRATEGMTAVALAHGANTAIALTKWTGVDLPGSVASTYRYRLVTVAPPAKSVTLGTKLLKPGWIASFCQDRLCSPNTVTFTMPAQGVKTYEFQLVAPTPNATPGRVAVGAADSNWVTIPAQ